MKSLNQKEFSIWLSYTRKEEQGPLKTLELLSDMVVKLAETSHVILKLVRVLALEVFLYENPKYMGFAQRSGGCSILGDVQGHTVQGSEKPVLAVGARVCCKEIESYDL